MSSSSSLVPAFPSREDCEIEFVPRIQFNEYSSIDCNISNAPPANFEFPLAEFPLPVPPPSLPLCECPDVETELTIYESSQEPIFDGNIRIDSSLSCCKWDLVLHLGLPPIPDVDDICPEIDASATTHTGTTIGDPEVSVTVSSSTNTCGFGFDFHFSFPDYCPDITATGTVDIVTGADANVNVSVSKNPASCADLFSFQFTMPDFCPDVTGTATISAVTGSDYDVTLTVADTGDCGFQFQFAFTMPDFQSQIDDIWNEINNIWTTINDMQGDIDELSSSSCIARWL